MAASYDLPRLLDLLVKHFSLEELHTLAFDLGVDYELLGGSGKEARAREFLQYLDHRGRIPQLLDAVREQRSQVRWQDAYGLPDVAKPSPASDPAPGAPPKEPVVAASSPPNSAISPAAEETPGGPTVFISYSHKDEAWKDRLVVQLGVLQRQGLLDLWDDRRIGAGDDWRAKIAEAMGRASVAILMVTADFLTSQFILGEEVPALLKRRDAEGLRVFPVIVKPCAWKTVPWLSRMQVRPKDGRPLSGGTEFKIDADLAAIAEEIGAIVQGAVRTDGAGRQAPLPPEKVSFAKLPSTSPVLFGRDRELKALDEAWADPKVHVLSLVAWGGVGKTALMNRWRIGLEQDGWRGAVRAFGWSFYSQGAAERRQASADQFIAAALAFFDDPDPNQGSPWDKAERLAGLIKRQRTLLILDGVEPLQNPPPVEPGRIKDPGLCCLLRELASSQPGLCLVTTRLPLDDLKEFTGSAHIQIDLEQLAPEDGAAYLAHLGVRGSKAEVRDASEEFDGHALALTLLGRYLATVYRGDVRQRDKVARLTDERRQGAHARRVMESYERWFRGKPELDILHVMGLFDRPADAGAIAALRKKPPIAGLTTTLLGLSDADWGFALANLRDAKLLAAEDPAGPDNLDAHPLVREHFGEQLQREAPAAWREAHGRLFEHYKSVAKEYPDTIEEMAPLYAAVAHGCRAGRHQEALDEVYWRRIKRGKEHYSWRKFGAFGADLAALSGFFDPPWRRPVDGLTEADKSFVLNEAGFDLRALGRLADAVEPMQASVEDAIALETWTNVARGASNLSELSLAAGDVAGAIRYAEQSVELADRSGDAFLQLVSRTTLADALHQAGDVEKAGAAFREAKTMEAKDRPEFPLLLSLRGYQYCDLLLGGGQYTEVQRRASQTLKWAEEYFGKGMGLLDIGLDHLSLGRAYLGEAVTASGGSADIPGTASPGTQELFSQATTHLEQAVDGLRRAGTQHHIPRGLLARAALRRATGAQDRARGDLEEAMSIATRGGMRLHEADCHLEYARLCLAAGEAEAAREHLARAKAMVAETGYHRRDGEVAALEQETGDRGQGSGDGGQESGVR